MKHRLEKASITQVICIDLMEAHSVPHAAAWISPPLDLKPRPLPRYPLPRPRPTIEQFRQIKQSEPGHFSSK